MPAERFGLRTINYLPSPRLFPSARVDFLSWMGYNRPQQTPMAGSHNLPQTATFAKYPCSEAYFLTPVYPRLGDGRDLSYPGFPRVSRNKRQCPQHSPGDAFPRATTTQRQVCSYRRDSLPLLSNPVLPPS
jgi:hypothetical protein